jgi:serine/threonine protein kinase/tetratricopeptide (TPR) repeat protein
MTGGGSDDQVTCPHCGATLPASADRCFACARAVRPQRQVAAGVLTPPPITPKPADTDETVFIDPQGASLEDDATRFEPTPPGTRAEGNAEPGSVPKSEPEDPNVTRYVHPDEATEFVDPEATGFVEPAAEDPDATSFVDPDVTRFAEGAPPPAQNDETRFVEPASSSTPRANPLTRPPTRPTTRPPTRPPTGNRPGTTPGTRSGAKTTEGPNGPLDVGQAFSNRYHIIRVLGIGGMGAVYHAWDTELGMAVALKVIRPESSNDPAAAREMERRFKQELVLARQVTHKNVVRIHDLGEVDGIKYITMPYLEGSDLATVLKERGKLPIAEALPIVRDVAAGLTAAHEAGIVHRELKPANIMVLKDRAVIMDFGIARSSKLAADAANPAAPADALDSMKSAVASTMVGTILGTVQYMAPEQAKAMPVDQRADVYALGLIFLDMLVGKRHSHAASAIEELKARIEQPPPLAQTIDPSIPKPIEQVIAKCLQPDREQRYQTSAELVGALDRLDEKGELIPIKRTIRLPYAIAAIVLLLAISVGVWWYQRQFIPPTKHETVKVIIADFQNNTKDASFDRTLEPMVKRALEGAGFVVAFDRDGITRTLGVQPPDRLDEAAARTLAAKQGVGVVVAGTIDPQGQGYRLSLKAVQALTGELISSDQSRAASKDRVLDTATRLVTGVRSALGDEASESAQMFAMATLSTTSLEVLRYWVAAREASASRKYDEALRNYEKAVQVDPKFGLGYQGLANVYANLSNQTEARKYANEALRHVSSMTDREKFTTRGGFYRLTGDYRQCVKEYSELLTTYPADVAAHNNLAICWYFLRDFSKAVKELQQVVAIVPNRAAYRANLANAAAFNSDFVTAEREARKVVEPDVITLIVLAFSQLGQGQLAAAAETYQKAAAISPYGASLAASGLADLANLEGRFSDAAQILEKGVPQDVELKRPDLAAAKLAALARTQLWRGETRAAIAAAEKALTNYDGLNIRFMAARTFVEAGRLDKANLLIAAMAKELLAEPQAYAKILEGEIALKKKELRQAIERFNEANALLDTWLAHFGLGRAYFEAGLFAQADSEFDGCLKRRGETLQLVLNDEPTYAFLPPAHYYLGRVREELKSEGSVDSYRDYLKFRGTSTEDPLVKDVKKRIGG